MRSPNEPQPLCTICSADARRTQIAEDIYLLFDVRAGRSARLSRLGSKVSELPKTLHEADVGLVLLG